MFTAVSTEAPRAAPKLVFASTSRTGQPGQIADTMSTSSEISPAQPALGTGSGAGWPTWLTLVKQPLAVVHAGSPNWARYTARSASAFGSSKASTMATVRPEPATEDGRSYADCRLAGPYPAGVKLGWTPLRPLTSIRDSAKHRDCPVLA